MQAIERKAVFSLSTVLALRLFGLVMILPVLALYTTHFKHANPLLIGIALGIYGLTQALLQLPFGITSDTIGRKPIMTIGFILLTLGSLLCATTTHILGLIIGRALQGACAISSTLSATLADLIRSEQRTKAMAILGAFMGIVFSTSMVAGSLLNAWIGIQGLFWLTALLALLAIILLHTWVPTPPRQRLQTPLTKTQVRAIATHPTLWRINLSITLQHALLIANFTALPPLLQHITKLPSDQLWHLYLPTMVIAFITILPLIRLIEKRQCFKTALITSVLALSLSEAGLWLQNEHLLPVFLSLLTFFTAFSLLEALLPSLTSRLATPTHKGTAMGFYSTGQFLGMFLGGLTGGLIYHYLPAPYVFLFGATIALLWAWPLINISINLPIEKKNQNV